MWQYFYFVKNLRTVLYSDCSHDIKGHLLLGRKVMTNLDSVLKSSDITLPTKVRLLLLLSRFSRV